MKFPSFLTQKALFGALIIIACLALVSIALSHKKYSECYGGDVEKAFYGYRTSLYGDDLSAVIDYFSDEYIRSEIIPILESNEFFAFNNVQISQKRFLFGASIVGLFRTNVSCIDNECDYDILYNNTPDSAKLRRLVIGYRCTDSKKPLINQITHIIEKNEINMLKPIATFDKKLSEKLLKPSIDDQMERYHRKDRDKKQ